jgi:DNA-binding MarR family transcriptional regulator
MAEWETRIGEAAVEVGLSPVSVWALVQLDPEHPISQKELASRLHCTPSTVVDPTDRLEEHGLVVRQTDRRDRRVNVLVVTEEGRGVRERLIRRLFEPPAALSRLPAPERDRLRDAMLAAAAGTRRGAGAGSRMSGT